jgi:hypothetical protein
MTILHTYTEWFDLDDFPEMSELEVQIRVRYSYYPEERESFNYVTGVGNPGCGASIEIFDISIRFREGAVWIPIADYPKLSKTVFDDDVETRILEEHLAKIAEGGDDPFEGDRHADSE